MHIFICRAYLASSIYAPLPLEQRSTPITGVFPPATTSWLLQASNFLSKKKNFRKTIYVSWLLILSIAHWSCNLLHLCWKIPNASKATSKHCCPNLHASANIRSVLGRLLDGSYLGCSRFDFSTCFIHICSRELLIDSWMVPVSSLQQNHGPKLFGAVVSSSSSVLSSKWDPSAPTSRAKRVLFMDLDVWGNPAVYYISIHPKGSCGGCWPALPHD